MVEHSSAQYSTPRSRDGSIRRLALIVGFAPIVLFALGCDSRWLLERGVDGQVWSNLAGPIYFALLLGGLRPEQRLMVLIFVPFSALGEYLFSLVFGLYSYKFSAVPLYVPFGHAILFGTGLLLAELPLVTSDPRRTRLLLGFFHAALFAGALLLYGDTLSALFGAVFIWLMRRKGSPPLYLIMGVLVLYIELVGTAFGCWVWAPRPLGLLHTTNPPVGAFVCYVIADVIVIRLAGLLAPYIATIPGILSRDRHR